MPNDRNDRRPGRGPGRPGQSSSGGNRRPDQRRDSGRPGDSGRGPYGSDRPRSGNQEQNRYPGRPNSDSGRPYGNSDRNANRDRPGRTYDRSGPRDGGQYPGSTRPQGSTRPHGPSRPQGPSGPPSSGPRRDGYRRDERSNPGRPDSGRPGSRDGYRRDDSRRDFRGDRDRNRPAPRDSAPRPPAEPLKSRTGLNAFDLFCAYHLGIAPDKSYRPANVNTVARRFGVSPADIKQALQDFGMDSAVVMEKEFDMAMAQLDMELAPEGIDRVELARTLFEEFTSARRKKIDWRKIIEEDIRENSKVFGRKD